MLGMFYPALPNFLIRVVIALAFLASPMLTYRTAVHIATPSAKVYTSDNAVAMDFAFATDDHEQMAESADVNPERSVSADRHTHPVQEDSHHEHALIGAEGTGLANVNDTPFLAFYDQCLGNGPDEFLRPPRSHSSPSEEA
jgi:hypothetical protein